MFLLRLVVFKLTHGYTIIIWYGCWLSFLALVLGAPEKGIIVRLQACSKVITLTALGFTLTAAGAFYSLNEAQSTLDAQYDRQLKTHLSTVGSDLSHYVQRINNDYYQLINLSLANVLALGQPYYKKDPLLSFFEHNFRHTSPYSQGENLLYALEALNYFKIPYVSYNFATKELKVHGAQDDKHENRILNARAQDGTKLKDLINTRSTLTQSFGIFYFGGDTYLCLKIYDRATQSNYFIVDSYLSVLNNAAVNVKKIFSDIDPVMQGILKDDNVMIVRRGSPIFKTQNFKLKLDLQNGSLRKLVGIHIVDHDGNIIHDPQNLKSGQEAYILGVSYLSSINSYLVMQRPFESYKSDNSFITLSKIFIILLSLVFVGLVAVNVYRSGLAEQDKKQRFAQLIKKMQSMSPQELQERLKNACAALLAHKNNSQHSADSSSELEHKDALTEYKKEQDLKDKKESPSADSQNSKNKHDSTQVIATPDSEAKSDAKSSKGATSERAMPEANKAEAAGEMDAKYQQATDLGSEHTGDMANHSLLDSELAIEHLEAKSDAKSSKGATSERAMPEANKAEAAGEMDAKYQQATDLGSEHTGDMANHSLLDSELAIEHLSDDDLLFVQNYLVDELLKDSGIKNTSLEAMMAGQTFRLSAALDSDFQQSIHELKDHLKNEFKSRINIHRMEGKFMAARSMLLSALPAEDAMPSSNFIDFAACTVPARELSGNFYTMKRLKAGNLAFVIGDCSSSGVKAAYTVTVVNTLLEEALRQDLDPAQILSFINERLCAISKVASVSLFVGIISETTGNVITSNAGHCCPILIANNQPQFIGHENELRLGVDKDLKFEISKCSLSTDDMILLYTNGVLNVKNNEDISFGIERLFEHCQEAKSMRADELVINVLNDIKLHKGKRPFREDVSLICIKQLLTELK